MGLFGSIFKGLTGPFRGIGNLVQGKFKKALGAFGSTAKLAAPILGATGVGAPLAIGLGAAGGAAESWGEDKNIIKGALGGAAGGAAGVAGRAAFASGGPLSGIGKFVTGGGGGVGSVAGTAAEEVVEPLGGGALSWLAKNPGVVTGVLGTGADVYGGYQQGKAADLEFKLREDELARRREEDERRDKRGRLQMLMSLYSAPGRF